MVGPRPPAVGGMVSAMTNLAAALDTTRVTLLLFDSNLPGNIGTGRATRLLARLKFWYQWWRLLGGFAPHAVHIHTCSGLSYFLDVALLLLARARGARVVLHVHGGRFDRFLDELGPVRGALARRAARSAAAVLVVSKNWENLLSPRLPGARLIVIENAVVLPQPLPARVATQVPLFLFLGLVTPEKGVADLLAAAAKLAAPAEILIGGPAPDAAFLARMQALAQALPPGVSVRFAGVLDAAQKAHWWPRTHCFVLPSHLEALPISVLEAMAAAVPVLATRVGSLPEVIDSGRDGVLVAPGDPQALAREMNRLIADPRLAAGIGHAGRITCEARFDMARVADRLCGLYGELVAA